MNTPTPNKTQSDLTARDEELAAVPMTESADGGSSHWEWNRLVLFLVAAALLVGAAVLAERLL